MPSPPRRAETAASLADSNPRALPGQRRRRPRCRAAPATQATSSTSAAAAPAPAPPPPPDDPTPPPPPDDAPPPPAPPPPGDRASAAPVGGAGGSDLAPDAGASAAEVRRLADAVASLQRGHEALARQMAELTAQRDAQRVRADALEEQVRRLAASVDRLRSPPPPPPPPPSAGTTRVLPRQPAAGARGRRAVTRGRRAGACGRRAGTRGRATPVAARQRRAAAAARQRGARPAGAARHLCESRRGVCSVLVSSRSTHITRPPRCSPPRPRRAARRAGRSSRRASAPSPRRRARRRRGRRRGACARRCRAARRRRRRRIGSAVDTAPSSPSPSPSPLLPLPAACAAAAALKASATELRVSSERLLVRVVVEALRQRLGGARPARRLARALLGLLLLPLLGARLPLAQLRLPRSRGAAAGRSGRGTRQSSSS